MSTKVVTPPGRIVWGNPLEGRPKQKNGQPVLKDGKQVIEYAFGLAIPKADFGVAQPNQTMSLAQALQAEAAAACPQGVPNDFSYKIKDGDTANDGQGRPLRDKPGNAGCYILSLSTEYPIPVFKAEGAGFVQLTQGVKTGDFCRVEVQLNGHGRDPKVMGSKPGLYANPTMVEFLGFGEEIRGGAADPSAAFGARVALPPGASATPVATHAAPAVSNGPFNTTPPQEAPPAPVQPNSPFPWGGN